MKDELLPITCGTSVPPQLLLLSPMTVLLSSVFNQATFKIRLTFYLNEVQLGVSFGLEFEKKDYFQSKLKTSSGALVPYSEQEITTVHWLELLPAPIPVPTASAHGDPHVPVAVFVPISLRFHCWQRTVPILYLPTTNGEHCTGDAIEMCTPQAW